MKRKIKEEKEQLNSFQVGPYLSPNMLENPAGEKRSDFLIWELSHSEFAEENQ